MKKITIYIILLAIFLPGVFAVDNLMALQGTVNTSSPGSLLVTIWDSPTGGNLIYNSSTDFANAILRGRYDVMLGSGSKPLALEYGHIYYLDMEINNQNLDFNGSGRQQFQSSIGNVTSTYLAKNSITTEQVIDGSLLGADISGGSIDKGKINLSDAWFESEIPSLTNAWGGTVDASRIVSQLLLNVNNSQYLQGYSATIFFTNDTSLALRIDAINSSANLKKLGFNLTSELDNKYYASSNPNGFISSYSENDPQIGIVTASQMCVGNGTGINCNVSIPSGIIDNNGNVTSIQFTGTATKTLTLQQDGKTNLTATFTDSTGSNSTSEIQAVYYPTLQSYANASAVFSWLSTYTNLSQMYTALGSYLNASDQRFNETTFIANVNTSANVKKLGFNLTSELDNKYYASTNPSGFISSYTDNNGNVTSVQFTGTATKSLNLQQDGKTNLTATFTDIDTDTIWQINATTFINESGKLGWNYTTLDSNFISQSEYPYLDTNNSDDMTLADNSSLWIKISNLNRSENIKYLGFNLTSELDDRFVSIGTKLGNSTEEIDAVTYPELSTYANQSWVQEQGYAIENRVLTNWTSVQYNTTAVATTNIPQLTINLSANSVYMIYCQIMTRSTAVGIGERLNVTIKGTATVFQITYLTSVSATTITPFAGTTVGQNLLADTGAGGANLTTTNFLQGSIVTNANRPTIEYGLYSETAANYVAVMPYSWCKYEKVA